MPPSPEELIASGPTSDTTNDKLVTQSAPPSPEQPAAETPLDDIPFDDTKFTGLKPVSRAMDALKAAKEEASKIKKEEAPSPTEEKKEVELEVKPLTIVAKEVDLSGFDETEQVLLKKMANDARQFVTSRLTELKDIKAKNKELESKLVEASKGPKIEMQGMHLLDKEFQESVMGVERISREANAWERALSQIDGGEEKIAIPSGYAEDGSFTYQETVPSTQLRAMVIRKLSESQGYIDKHKSRANHIASTYNDRYQERISAVKQYEDYIFPELADPKVAEANPAIKAMKSFLQKSGFGDNILASALSKMYAFAMAKDKAYEELAAKNTVKETVKEVRASSGPTGGEINNGRTGNTGIIDYKNPDEIPFDPDAFDKKKG